MKKAFAILLPVFAAISLTAQETRPNMEIKQFEEQKVESNREFYGDLPARMTKVVIAGDNSMTDLIFKNAVEESWNISPFEFCNYDEFERIRTDTNYYFLMRLDKMHRSENDPAMEFVCFLKGNEKAGDNISAMPELIALPLFPADDNSDRIYTYLPAYMNIIQNYLQKIVDGRIYPSKRGVIQTGTFEKNRNTKSCSARETWHMNRQCRNSSACSAAGLTRSARTKSTKPSVPGPPTPWSLWL